MQRDGSAEEGETEAAAELSPGLMGSADWVALRVVLTHSPQTQFQLRSLPGQGTVHPTLVPEEEGSLSHGLTAGRCSFPHMSQEAHKL